MNDFYSMLTPEFLTVILLPALIGGIAVTLCSSLLGVSLVLKRYSMIGDGLSHVGFGALSVAAVMNLAPLKVAIPVVILAAVFLLRLSEHSQLKGDSTIAIFSTSALAIGVLVSSKAGLTNDVSHYMFGSILAMSREDVLLSVVLSLLVIAAYLLLYHKIYAITFDEDFAKATGTNVRFYNLLLAVLTAVTVVLGMMMMGALLISSLIIFPSVTAMRVCRSFRSVVICAALVSVVCFLFGFFLSLTFDTAPGASVVVANLVVFLLFTLIGRLRSGGKATA